VSYTTSHQPVRTPPVVSAVVIIGCDTFVYVLEIVVRFGAKISLCSISPAPLGGTRRNLSMS